LEIRQQIAIPDIFYGRDRGVAGMAGENDIAAAANPDIAKPVAPGRVEEENIRLDGRHQHHWIATALERIVDHTPILAMLQHVGAEKPTHRAKRGAFLAGL